MKALASILDDLSEEISPTLIEVLKEATRARENVTQGEESAGLPDIHTHLVRNRSMIEFLENATARLTLLKSRTAKAVATRKGAYDDAYMKAATKPSVGFADYASAKEKDAHYNLSTIEETMALRKAEAMHRDVESAWDYCRQLLRGAEGVQRDLETRIRLITLTSSLER